MAKRPGHVIVVDEERCFGCAACIAVCPLDALELEGILAIPTEDKCTHCDLCIPVCPVHALEIKEETILAGEYCVHGLLPLVHCLRPYVAR